MLNCVYNRIYGRWLIHSKVVGIFYKANAPPEVDGLTTRFGLVIGTASIIRRRNLREKMAQRIGLRKNEVFANTLDALVAVGFTFLPRTTRKQTTAYGDHETINATMIVKQYIADLRCFFRRACVIDIATRPNWLEVRTMPLETLWILQQQNVITATGNKQQAINTTPKYALSPARDDSHLSEQVALVPSRPYLDHPTKGATLKPSE